jgi:hypothetical protein
MNSQLSKPCPQSKLTNLFPCLDDLTPDYKKGIHRDEWGTTWRSKVDSVHGQVYDYLLKDYGDLAYYRFPPITSGEDLKRLKMWG